MATNVIPISETMRKAAQRNDKPTSLCVGCIHVMRLWATCEELHNPTVRMVDGRHLVVKCLGRKTVQP